MIDNITYEEMENISRELSNNIDIIRTIIKDDDFKEINDFIATVDGYAKYLNSTVKLYQDADSAIIDLK